MTSMDGNHGVQDQNMELDNCSAQGTGGSFAGELASDNVAISPSKGVRIQLLEHFGNAFKAVQSSLSPKASGSNGAKHIDNPTQEAACTDTSESIVANASKAALRNPAVDIRESLPQDRAIEMQQAVDLPSSSNGKEESPKKSPQQSVIPAKTGVASFGAAAAMSWQGWAPHFFLNISFAWRLTYRCMRLLGFQPPKSPCAEVKRLVDRVQRTIRGSSDDIGWLQRMPDLPPAQDRTERFATLLGRITNGVHTLPDSLVYLLVPGLFSNHGPLYFTDTKKHFSKLGLPCHIARIHSEASVETNAKELKQYVEELYWGTGKKVVMLGHSKGGVDGAAAIAKYWDSLRDKVVGIVLIQSPYGGSPVASDLLREGQLADTQSRQIIGMAVKTVLQGDLTALDDLTYDKRRKFLASYPLPASVPCVCFHSEASRAPGVLATLSHIAHADLPWSSKDVTGVSEQEALKGKVPVAVPLAAVMAVCALHLELRYGAASDGMVARKDAEVPGSAVVRPVRRLDHGWMVYSPMKKDPKEVDAAQMCEALITLLLDCFPQIKKASTVNTATTAEPVIARGTGLAAERGSPAEAESSAGASSGPDKHDAKLQQE